MEDKRLNSHAKTLTLINVPLTSGLLARFPRSLPVDRTSSDSVSSPEVNEGLGTTGSGKVSSLLFFCICEAVYFSQLKKMTELTSQLHCSKSVRERTLRVKRNADLSGIKLDWEPKFKRKLGHIIKHPNDEQRERPTIVSLLLSVGAAPISDFDLSLPF